MKLCRSRFQSCLISGSFVLLAACGRIDFETTPQFAMSSPPSSANDDVTVEPSSQTNETPPVPATEIAKAPIEEEAPSPQVVPSVPAAVQTPAPQVVVPSVPPLTFFREEDPWLCGKLLELNPEFLGCK